jgi:hypothetical protein
MVRNVVVGRLRPGVDSADVEAALQAVCDLPVLTEIGATATAGLDLGLRDDAADYAITVDLPDEDAYRTFDADEEHNRVRREMFAPISASVTRIQFRLPG